MLPRERRAAGDELLDGALDRAESSDCTWIEPNEGPSATARSVERQHQVAQLLAEAQLS